MKSFRRHYLLVAVVMMAVLLTGCFGKGEKDEKVKLSLEVTLAEGGEGKVEDVTLLVGGETAKLNEDGKVTVLVSKGDVKVEAVLKGYETHEGTIKVEKDAKYPAFELKLEVTPDPEVPTVEELVKAVEDFAVTSYDELVEFDEQFEAAGKAVAEVKDEADKKAFNDRLAAQQVKVDKAVKVYVDALKEAKNQINFFNALDNFWTVEQKFSAEYYALYSKTYNVYEIQEKIVEAVSLDKTVASEIYEVAKSGNEFELQAVLEKYQEEIGRKIYFDDPDYVQAYMKAIQDKFGLPGAAAAKSQLELIQEAIDAVNKKFAEDAVLEAETKFDRALAETARELVEALEEEHQEALTKRLDKLFARMDVYDADEDSLVDALKALAKADAGFSSIVLEKDIHVERESAYFEKIHAETVAPATRKDPELTAGLIKAVNNELNIKPVEFTAEYMHDNLGIFRAAETVLTDYIAEYLTGEFDITAFNDLGKKIDDKSKYAEPTLVRKADGKEIKAADVENVGVLQVRIQDKAEDFKVRTNIVSINLVANPNPAYSTLEADKEKYVAGETITLTLTAGYKEESGKNVVLTTLNGAYPATVGFSNGYAQNSSVTFVNGVGTIEVIARNAGKEVYIQVFNILGLDFDYGDWFVLEENVEIVHGEASKLTAELFTEIWEDESWDFIWLTVTDGWNRITDFGAQTASISFEKSKASTAWMPDADGIVNVEFNENGLAGFELSDCFGWDVPTGAGTFTITVGDLIAKVVRP